MYVASGVPSSQIPLCCSRKAAFIVCFTVKRSIGGEKVTGPSESLSDGPVTFSLWIAYNLLRGLSQLIDKLLIEPDAVLAVNPQTIMGVAIRRWCIVLRK
jgi:hypothetical protein